MYQQEGGDIPPEWQDTGHDQPSFAPLPPKAETQNATRFDEPLKFLPVLLVVLTILILAYIYVVYHCFELLQLGEPERLVDKEMRWRGEVQLIFFAIFTTFLLIAYLRSIIVHPGTIPDGHPHWEYFPQAATAAAPTTTETKKTGQRRHCKWCGKYKPDRCHHCRVCNQCILKMDHHCPWIYNCVGFWNYKYFFLLLFYTVLDCHLIFWSSLETVQRTIENDDDFTTMFLVSFASTLSFFLGLLFTSFFSFHFWLMQRNMTTIEFCEKNLKNSAKQQEAGPMVNRYDIGCFGNIRKILGPHPACWLIPCDGPEGDGLAFVDDEAGYYGDQYYGHGQNYGAMR
eukprot:TRINITY_DN81342_c0_g1_i1.p1 TRINITY_DN81342_c0_g1~~TRINITY_DN81342_c0_g1_i1.p1  ORF type:complete len:342 (+),score=56.81 TRINITY_DN81342_c0_g1_i1:147-1172(+)